jgi:hypothetical protein
MPEHFDKCTPVLSIEKKSCILPFCIHAIAKVSTLRDVEILELFVRTTCLLQQPTNDIRRVDFVVAAPSTDVENGLVSLWEGEEANRLSGRKLPKAHGSCM